MTAQTGCDPHSRAPDARAAVAVDGLTKVFRDFWRRPRIRAVDGISFCIGPGEIFGLLGPNGSGKSTTLKLLLGLLFPTAGNARVLGCAPRDVRTKQRIGYLPEESHLYNSLTPRETLTFFGRLFPLPARPRRGRIEELLALTGLQDAADRPVGEFSKGMARRLGLAQALINDPQLIILDEPTAGLDPIGRRNMKDLMLSLAAAGKTVLLSSHLLADVEDVCDRVVILDRGTIAAQGRVRDLLAKPDRLRITLPDLPANQRQALAAELRKWTGVEPEIDHPSLNLEEFFLRVVRSSGASARRAQGETVRGGDAP